MNDEASRRRRRPARATAALAAVSLLFLPACEDELSEPEVRSCDETIEVVVEEVPTTVRYLVAADGNAVVNSVTYATPTGPITVDSPTAVEGGSDIVLREDVEFAEAATATLRAQGEVATGGQIGLTYSLIPDDQALPVETGPITLCGG